MRLDFSILWADLVEIAAPEDAGLLASRVDLVWRVVDEFATRTHMSYLTERVGMAQEESEHPARIHRAALQRKHTLGGNVRPGRFGPGYRS